MEEKPKRVQQVGFKPGNIHNGYNHVNKLLRIKKK